MSSLLSPSNRVLAIEPSPSARVLLARNLARSGYAEKVLVFEGAATATAGQFTIHTIPGLEEYSSLTEIVHFSVQNRSSQSLPIVGQPIDVLVDRFGLRPGIIKIDTEGAEFAVLSGAMNTLKMLRPIVVTEVYDPMLAKHGATSQMLVELLRAQAYSVVRFEFPEILAIPEELRCPEHAL
jgi:FkbM family methyltransferase